MIVSHRIPARKVSRVITLSEVCGPSGACGAGRASGPSGAGGARAVSVTNLPSCEQCLNVLMIYAACCIAYIIYLN